MIAAIGSRIAILLFGTLYPAYASYKAVRNKDVKAYVTWMMYWIVFALFTCVETLSDVFLSFWVPFYYEMKVILVLWLLSPATKGSSFLYRKFVHPALTEREKEIDEYLAKMKERSYSTMVELGSKGINYALQTAIKSALLVYKGGGGLVSQLKKSYSLGDLNEEQVDAPRRRAIRNEIELTDDEEDVQDERRVAHRGYAPRRTQSGSSRVDMYFSAVDVNVRQRGSHTGDATNNNLAASKAASTLSSADVDVEEMDIDGLTRTSSVNSRPRTRRSISSTGAKSQSGRPKSTVLASSVTDVLEAELELSSFNSLLDPFSDIYNQSEMPARKSTVIIEELESEEDFIALNEELETVHSKSDVEESDAAADEDFFEASSNEELGKEPDSVEQVAEEPAPVPPEVLSKEEDPVPVTVEDPAPVPQEVSSQEEDPVLVAEDPAVIETVETPVGMGEIPEIIENIEMEKSDEAVPLVKELETEEVKKEDSPDVVMKVEVSVSEDHNLGHTSLIRMSLESLPTTLQAAEEMDRAMQSCSPCASVSSLISPDNEQESRCSTPSSTKTSGARAGRYNKRPAPPRPTEVAPDDDGPLKARLVLKPGVVRHLPEADNASKSEETVFLNTDSKEKKRESKSSLLSFWHTKPEKSSNSSSKKMTDL
ncbi:uncharacterized protein LOC135938940 isoform X1 [Cloeon dipterum]|uniref:uncharacterized protein LOC135938940 isoform X1 n=1 Tax=Cloeon dipterum TaxID=197152 RepID=UPI0032203B19